MQSLSALLKNRREDLNFSLETISEQTKIRIEYLRDLEEGRYENFPSEVYLKGFLKTYARFLNLDNSLVQALYRREQAVRSKREGVKPISLQFKEPVVILTRKRVAILIGIVIFLAILVVGFTQFTRLTKLPELTLTEPVKATEADKELVFSTSGDTLNIAGKVELGSSVTINGQKVVLNQLDEFRIDSYKIDKEEMVLDIKATNQFGKVSEITLNIFKKPADQTTTSTSSTQAVQNTMLVKLDVLQDTNLKLTLDGNVKVNRNVTGGTIFDESQRPDFNLQATNKVELTLPDPSKVNIYLNGSRYNPVSGTTTWSLINGNIVQN